MNREFISFKRSDERIVFCFGILLGVPSFFHRTQPSLFGILESTVEEVFLCVCVAFSCSGSSDFLQVVKSVGH